jgi:hypothetical protein
MLSVLAKHLFGAAGSMVTEGHPLRRVTTHDSRQRDLVAELRIGFLQSGSLAAEWDADMH